MKKKPKKGGKPDGKPMTKQETVESFFNFFSPPEVPPQGTNLDEKEAENLQELMEEDYEMGCVQTTVRVIGVHAELEHICGMV
jgi:nucleosome assembly protein 1-like 1